MMPNTIYLEYPEGFNQFPEAQLPNRIHTRESASTLEWSYYHEGRLSRMVIRSEYDALLDIVLELEILGDVGIVKNVSFKESK